MACFVKWPTPGPPMSLHSERSVFALTSSQGILELYVSDFRFDGIAIAI